MHAEWGIDDNGHAYIQLSGLTETEWGTMERLRAWLPGLERFADFSVRITGDRLPGMGSVKAQDATSKAI